MSKVSKKAAELMRKATEFIRRGWTQGMSACTEKNELTGINDLNAAKWCATGALVGAKYAMGFSWLKGRTAENQDIEQAEDYARDKFFAKIPSEYTIIGWNDSRSMATGQQEVIELMETIAKECEEEPDDEREASLSNL